MSGRIALNGLDARMLRLQGPERPWSVLLRVRGPAVASAATIDGALEALVELRPEIGSRLEPDLTWRTGMAAPMCERYDDAQVAANRA